MNCHFICNDVRDNPALNRPESAEQVLEALEKLLSAKRTNLVVRVPLGATGVALGGKELPNLPDSMVQVMSNMRRNGSQTVRTALVERHSTDWVIQGQESVSFRVTKNKKVTAR